MTKPVTILTALLVTQLIIAALLTIPSSNKDQAVASVLLAVDKTKLTAVTISTTDQTLTLEKSADEWQLQSQPSLPLVASKVKTLIDSLTAKQVTWPITTTESSHQRFKVSEDNFEKKISYLDQSGESQTLYLGSSPSYKQLYVRRDEDDAVYVIEFNSFELGVTPEQWFNRNLLALNDISAVSSAKLALEKVDDEWQFSSVIASAEQPAIDGQQVSEYVERFNRLSVTEIAAVDETQLTDIETIKVTDSQGRTFNYQFAQQDEHYLVKRDDIAPWFTLTEPLYQQIVDVSSDSFYQENVAKVTEEEGDETSNQTVNDDSSREIDSGQSEDSNSE